MFLSFRQRVFPLTIRRFSSLVDGLKNNRETGIVKRFSKDKGFGFIRRDKDGNDVFVHFQSIVGTGFKTLEIGQQVEFQVAEGMKGPEARDVHVKNQVFEQIKQSRTSNNERHIGVMRKYMKNRGFGFITRKSDGADFFVHSRAIRESDLESLNEGLEVEFSEIQTNRGGEAKDVRILKKIHTPDNTH